MTRRGILCTIASVYDPLGFVAPFILRGKQILQQLCQEKVEWDEPLSDQHCHCGNPRSSKLVKGESSKTCLTCKHRQCELHHFSDAGVTGYGKCSYLRTEQNKEIKDLTRGKDIQLKDKTHKLYSLSPFVDEQGVLRVGGQEQLYTHISNILPLSPNQVMLCLLIKQYHENVQHQGRGITVTELRSNRVCITGCSNSVASHIYKCTTCTKYRRHSQDHGRSDLPEDRMETTPPFSYCGIDCFGPFYVKEGRKELKRYGLLCTCMCSRAIHNEMLDDLTTDHFMNASCCFISICGHVIRCDQGTKLFWC